MVHNFLSLSDYQKCMSEEAEEQAGDMSKTAEVPMQMFERRQAEEADDRARGRSRSRTQSRARGRAQR